MVNKKAKALYVFRNSHVTYNKSEISIELVCSFNDNTNSKEIFVLGFFNCINKINKIIPFDWLLIENTSHNNIILDQINTRYKSTRSAFTSYYLWNYISRPINSNDVFILN